MEAEGDIPSPAGDADGQALLRRLDYPRYLSLLFAPPAIRGDLGALFRFAATIDQQAARARDPTLVLIRFRWWHDALAGALRGEDPLAPEIAAVAPVLARHGIDGAALLRLVDAKADRLEGEIPAEEPAIERFTGQTQSVLFQMAATIAAGPEAGQTLVDASGHGGVAYGIARDFLAQHGDTNAGASARDHAELALRHLDQCRRALAEAPPAARPAFLPLATLRKRLVATARSGIASSTPLGDVAGITLAAWTGGWRRP